MTGTQPIDINKMIEMLKPEAIALVKHIEASPATTQYHYGDYLEVITRVQGRSQSLAQLLVIALGRAGANRDGLRHAAEIAGIVE